MSIFLGVRKGIWPWFEPRPNSGQFNAQVVEPHTDARSAHLSFIQCTLGPILDASI